MDSCSSSPSHSFKDRPHSRHGDPSRQPSFPHNLDRAKSPAPKAVSENRGTSSRDLARRSSYGACGSEKEGGDSLLSSPERSRSSLRKSFGFDRVERHGDSKAELHRSTRVHTPSRNPDRESIDMGGRVPSRRSSHGGDGHRHEGSEGVSTSPLQGGAFKRGYERESGEIKQRASKSPECDDEASRSPASGKGVGLIRNDGKDSFKGSPRTSLGCASKRDLGGEARTPRTSPAKEGLEKGKLASPIKASGRERLDEMDVTSPKTKLSMVKEKEMHKEQEANSGEPETKSSIKNITTKSRNGGGDDTMEGEQWLKAKDPYDEKSMSFLHISKRARSDRDRGRRDEHSVKASVRHTQGNENVMDKECSVDRLGFDGSVKKTDGIDSESGAKYEARHKEDSFAKRADSGTIRTNERSSENMEIECPVSNNGHNSDMEEGELEPESHIEQGKAGFREEKVAGSKEREEIEKQHHAVLSRAPKGKEGCDSVTRVAAREEKILNGNGEERHRSIDDADEDDDSKDVKMLSPERTENCGVSVDLEFTVKSAPVSSAKVSELGESSRTGLMFDLLGTRTEAKSLNSLSADKGLDTNRELTLSLFTQPSEGEGALPEGDVQAKGLNGKQIENLHDLEAGLARPHTGGSGEESSQHSGHKQKKLKMESLQLSLALPGTSNMVAGSELLRVHAEPERSFQSLSHTQTQTQNPVQSQTYTNSDGFATSFSFSQSESFIHNPSCSLNCTSLENQELSCGGSKQFSQGTEQMSNRSWPALSGNDGTHTVTSLSQDKSKHRRGIPLYQRVLQNGSMHQGFTSVTGSNRSSGSNHVPQRSHHFGQRLQDAPKILDSSSQDLEGSGRHINTHKDIMERVRQQKAWFASKQQAMSGEPRSEPNASQSRDMPADSPAFNLKGPSSAGNDILVGERNVSSERVGLQEITTEPITAMAQKLQELPDSFLEGLKGLAKGVLGSFEKREEFIALQDNICRRTDLTEDSLLRAHRTQLEILVALKTGIQAFVQEGTKPQTYKALIEIFLQTRCRNVACQQPLPVCGCECRICSKRSGFCHECMCVICFKFDSDNNTCRWVGCDLCLHWCHTDCGLRMSHIAPTSAAKISSGTTEMQYHCVACDYKSELFGFVKDVFHKCAETWGAETLAKELDCVRRIFHGSEDMRGKQLCWKAEQMLQKLETKVEAAEVCRSMLRFLQEGNAELDGASGPNKKSSSSKANDAPCHAADLARESIPKATSSGGGSKLVDLDNARAVLHSFDRKPDEKRTEASELQYDRARKRAEIEDIESVVRMKQAEAKMFQGRADEARQEAGGLQRIISVKREKIDEDYACKYAKLRLSEAEERQRKRLEELHTLESAQQDFQKMKNRMEAEIKELMLKMEIAKRQFA